MSYQCPLCQKVLRSVNQQQRCSCGAPLDFEFDAHLENRANDLRPNGMWRYRDAIPIDLDQQVVSLGEGITPLIPLEWNGTNVFAKVEMLFPTGSFKDRGASVLLSRAVSVGARRIVAYSAGNAGCSIAAYAAAAHLPCEIFVPEQICEAKLAQIRAYGATVHRIAGNEEHIAQAARDAAHHDFFADHVLDPFFIHGTKTIAYEIWEQLGHNAPDVVLVPTGNGTLLLGVHRGFVDLMRGGHIPKMPRLIAVQAANVAPVYERFHNLPTFLAPSTTSAQGIAVTHPPRLEQIVQCIRATKGTVITVDEQSIGEAQTRAGHSGLFVEATSAVPLAALDLLETDEEDVIVVPLTGHGLKTAV